MARYHTRRPDREIRDEQKLTEILLGGKFATLGLCRGDEPYVVTMNYGYDAERRSLYFHCAPGGLKLEFLEVNDRVCATVIRDRGYLMGSCAHAYTSVVLRGRLRKVDALEEKKHALWVMIRHLETNPDEVRQRTLKDDDVYSTVVILRLDIEEITGKEGH